MRISSLSILLASALFGSAQAVEREADSYNIDTDITIKTDQRTRGISDSLLEPSLMLHTEIAHESGLIGLFEVARISKKQFPDGSGAAITLGLGYRWGDPDAWHFGVGAATERFPGAKFQAPHSFDMGTFTPGDFKTTDFNSDFLLFEANYGALEGRMLYVISDTYRGADTGGVCGQMLQLATDPTKALECYGRGDHNSRGTMLFDLDYTVDLMPATTLTLHVGHQKVKNFKEADFTDYGVGLTRTQWGLDWSLDWYSTNTNAGELYKVADGNKLRATDGDAVVFSITRRF
ncbi:hypothetical protein KQ940_10480 [Marinobacterium sp. D7]|uniref:TorF family putative porin n=1 Tax=Marinobacterium ramblicola TaxID=2849041 RepID=UPI001C2D80B7|nr:TorF family putative porin [Marinobacterium ramblicola]MBV1788483.1 hypothetical protein [Marinobacterium ramblicola]